MTGLRGGCGGMYCTQLLRNKIFKHGFGMDLPARDDAMYYQVDVDLIDIPEDTAEKLDPNFKVQCDQGRVWNDERWDAAEKAYRQQMEEFKKQLEEMKNV